jgi:hypothetical protein
MKLMGFRGSDRMMTDLTNRTQSDDYISAHPAHSLSQPLGLLAPPLGEAPSPNAPGANSDTVSPDELGVLKAEIG